MNFTKTGSYTYNGETKEYHYSPTATISEQIAFVEMVTDGVFISNSYLPLLKKPVFDYWVIATFTDIDMSEFVHIDAFDKFNKETGVAAHIKEDLDFGLLNNLTESVDANIEYKKGLAHDNISTAIVELINTVKDRLATWGEGLTADDALDFIDKFKQSGINGEDIVKTYLDSDNYKKNVLDIVDSKNADIKERDTQIADLKQKLNAVTARNVVADKSDKVIPIKSE